MQIEFEKKFVLHPQVLDVLHREFSSRPAAALLALSIWQAYGAGKADRVRATVDANGRMVFERERKTSIPWPHACAAQVEQSEPISRSEFLDAFLAAPRYVAKRRYCLGNQHPLATDHIFVVDAFVNLPRDLVLDKILLHEPTHFVMAEDEVIVDVSSRTVHFEFTVPDALRPFVLLEVDQSKPESKLFSSYNLHCDPQVIARTREIISALEQNDQEQLRNIGRVALGERS